MNQTQYNFSTSKTLVNILVYFLLFLAGDLFSSMLHTGGHILKNLRVSIFNSTRFFVAVVHHQYSHRRKNDGSTEMIKRNDGISEDDICQNQCATLVRA